MLTHYPDAEQAGQDDASAAGREMTDRVLQGELVRDSAGRDLAGTTCPGVRWLHRSVERSPRHHALCGYLAEEEPPVGTCFDTYV